MNYLQKSLAYATIVTLGAIIAGCALSEIGKTFGMPQLLWYPLNLIGAPPLVLGFFLRVWAASLFYKETQKIVSLNAPAKLIMIGPYKYSRNPLYLGLILLGLGPSLIFNSVLMLVLVSIGAVFFHFLILHEEKVLEKSFGKDYEEYKKRVRRWL